ncbi:hypothetical protein EMIHUDRAFT_248471 [Emiliania huxleyi CCMP1516]|uniref:EamA domain-containing protein n=2 Tax=Emiliania huxleyi TaxID=2903 RepID=A0A0D3IGD1_EMIH1|nr:hypothetical protein EMIHUDRAFT_248471 [Emiliania huxleyi CCMP1516]EOD10316.1 hypothetical protein EMIHUDRAFT_248471 [Emiliania huxleyi CCMP1516]|eukprot:XP_005762745.1 hypothetical protein EMIHUDRAFT_248471 [Emiliania huxleyi CCMP1516]
MSVGKAIGWSSGACALFGLQNYLIGATNSMPKDDFCRTVGLLWLSTGTCGVALLLRRPSRGVFYCDSHEHGGPPQRIGCIPKLATLSGGLALATAALFMKLSFAADPDAQGPLCSVVCADVILVSLLCHFFYDERLSRAQWLSVAAVFAGAMVSFGASVFSVRIASAGNLAASSGFIARALVMGKAAVPLLLRASWDGADRISIGLPLICGLLQAGGVYAINQALSVGPYTSMSIAIFGSNSIVVLLLAAVIEGRVPTAGALNGAHRRRLRLHLCGSAWANLEG